MSQHCAGCPGPGPPPPANEIMKITALTGGSKVSHADEPAMTLLAARTRALRRYVVSLGCQWKGCPDWWVWSPEGPLQACGDPPLSHCPVCKCLDCPSLLSGWFLCES